MTTNNDLEPCYSCPRGCRVYHDIGEYETVVCQCPDVKNGVCKCSAPYDPAPPQKGPGMAPAANIDTALNDLMMAIYEANRLYDPARALNLEARIINAYVEVKALRERNARDVANRLKHCDNPDAIHEEAPECAGCPNYTMALDGYPLCEITRRALQ